MKPLKIFSTRRCFFSLQRRAIFPHLNFKKWSVPLSFLAFWLENALLATATCNFSTCALQKMVRECCVLYILTWKVLLATAACNFSTSELQKAVRPCLATAACNFSTPELEKVHFDLQMCFSLQRRANFRHQNFKSGRNMQCFLLFDLKMCFSLQRRAIFHFSSKQLPPHPPLYQAYFSTQPSHKPLKKHSISRLA